jgi:ribosome biogenesis GTPase
LSHETLNDLGWRPHFQSQIAEAESNLTVARVLAVHRDVLEVAGQDFEGKVTPPVPTDDEEAPATVGDWVVLEEGRHRVLRVLARTSLFKRRSAGTARRVQLIAANVDTLLVVTSANEDFNEARLERYLALASEAQVQPVVVITKADLADDVTVYIEKVRLLMPGLVVEAVDARDKASLAKLTPWFGKGQTLALVGSSGVGKSTIVNSVKDGTNQATQAVRAHDAHGRHTTTGRSLHRLDSGAWIIDTPGMRELQIYDAASGVGEVFSDIEEAAAACRFSDCGHEAEPGCAVRAAIASGLFDEERLKRYRKLLREEQRNSESLAASRARSQRFGKMGKKSLEEKSRRKEW